MKTLQLFGLYLDVVQYGMKSSENITTGRAVLDVVQYGMKSSEKIQLFGLY